jgi:hypothetical protein
MLGIVKRMKKYLLLIMGFQMSYACIGQTWPDSLLIHLCERTLYDSFQANQNDTTSPWPLGINKQVLILQDSLSRQLQREYSAFTIKPVTQAEAIKLIEKRKNKRGELFKINTKAIGQDTIDVNFGSWIVEIRNIFKLRKGRIVKKEVYFLASCGGTMGYIPTARYIFDSKTRHWRHVSYQEIVAQKMEQRSQMLRERKR